jgi:hypothetical protein
MKYIGDQIGFFTNFGGKLVASLNLMILIPTRCPNVHSILLIFSFCFDACVFGEETCVRSCESEGKRIGCSFARIQEQNIESLSNSIEAY